MSNTDIDTLIGKNTQLKGDIKFRGGLHVDGKIKGNLTAEPNSDAVVTISEHGKVDGEIRAPKVIVDGTLEGDLFATERVELAARARVRGNVHYKAIQMAVGAQVNGTMSYEEQPGGKARGGAAENPRPVRAVGGE